MSPISSSDHLLIMASEFARAIGCICERGIVEPPKMSWGTIARTAMIAARSAFGLTDEMNMPIVMPPSEVRLSAANSRRKIDGFGPGRAIAPAMTSIISAPWSTEKSPKSVTFDMT